MQAGDTTRRPGAYLSLHRSTAQPSLASPAAAVTSPRVTGSSNRQQATTTTNCKIQNSSRRHQRSRRTEDSSDADARFIFRYSDGTAVFKPVKRLSRYGASVLVADLDLSERATAVRAARRGRYFDDVQGLRLFLQYNSRQDSPKDRHGRSHLAVGMPTKPINE